MILETLNEGQRDPTSITRIPMHAFFGVLGSLEQTIEDRSSDRNEELTSATNDGKDNGSVLESLGQLREEQGTEPRNCRKDDTGNQFGVLGSFLDRVHRRNGYLPRTHRSRALSHDCLQHLSRHRDTDHVASSLLSLPSNVSKQQLKIPKRGHHKVDILASVFSTIDVHGRAGKTTKSPHPLHIQNSFYSKPPEAPEEGEINRGQQASKSCLEQCDKSVKNEHSLRKAWYEMNSHNNSDLCEVLTVPSHAQSSKHVRQDVGNMTAETEPCGVLSPPPALFDKTCGTGNSQCCSPSVKQGIAGTSHALHQEETDKVSLDENTNHVKLPLARAVAATISSTSSINVVDDDEKSTRLSSKDNFCCRNEGKTVKCGIDDTRRNYVRHEGKQGAPETVEQDGNDATRKSKRHRMQTQFYTPSTNHDEEHKSTCSLILAGPAPRVGRRSHVDTRESTVNTPGINDDDFFLCTPAREIDACVPSGKTLPSVVHSTAGGWVPLHPLQLDALSKTSSAGPVVPRKVTAARVPGYTTEERYGQWFTDRFDGFSQSTTFDCTEAGDDLFLSTPIRSTIAPYRPSSIGNHGSKFTRLAAPKIQKAELTVPCDENFGVCLPKRIDLQGFVRKMKRDLRIQKTKTKKKSNRLTQRALHVKVSGENVKFCGRLSPGGSLKVSVQQALEDDYAFWFPQEAA